MNRKVESANFTAEYFDDDVADGYPAAWYVACKDHRVNMRDLADYAEQAVPGSYTGDGGAAEWECPVEAMLRCKVTVQALLADAESAYALYTAYDGVLPDEAVWSRSLGTFRHPTAREMYGE